MTPESFRLYDVLNCAATAVEEDGTGHWRNADRAWQAACTAAEGLFPPGSKGEAAADVILRAAAPSGEGCSKPGLLALAAASLAVLPAMAGDEPETALRLADAEVAAAVLAPELREALTVIAGEIGLMAMVGVT